MKMSSYLQFGVAGQRGGGNSPMARSVGMIGTNDAVHRMRVERHQLYLNMLKYKNKKRGL